MWLSVVLIKRTQVILDVTIGGNMYILTTKIGMPFKKFDQIQRLVCFI